MADLVENKRYIEIDKDTLVGFNYLKKKYYVTNKDTTTYRNAAWEVVAILEAMGITEITIGTEVITLTPEYLEETIHDPIELLEKIYYTMEDNGSYIRTLQFNDWEDYPLTVDCTQGNIYIKGTNILFSLSLDISPENKITKFCSYYLETLGLSIPKNTMTAAYRLLSHQYSWPYYYNLLSTDEETGKIKYTNIFAMANYYKVSPVTCNGVRNPYSKFNTSELGNIISTDNEDNLITLKEPLTPQELLMEGSVVSIQGTEQEIDGTVYNSDGTYTVLKLETNEDENITAIQTVEPIPSSYVYPYPTCYVESINCDIFSMERESNVIRVAYDDFPNNLLIGDTIYVQNAQVETDHELISLEGAYTVRDITRQVHQVEDSVLSMGTTGSSNTITINSSSTELQVGDKIKVSGTKTADDNISYTITGVTSSTNTIILQVAETIPYAYGNPTGGDINVTFTPTSATNVLELPVVFNNVVINAGDLIEISGITTSGPDANNRTFTILQVTKNPNGTTTLALDSPVVSYTGTANVAITPMSPVTLTGNTTLYYNIYTEEDIPTDFTSSVSQQATFYKEVLISEVTDIEIGETTSTITLKEIPSSANLSTGNTLFIYIQGEKYSGLITAIDSETREISLNSVIGEMPEYPTLSLNIPDTEILLNISSVNEYLEDVIPTGNFMLDDFEQCQNYIVTLKEEDNSVTSKRSYIPEIPDSINENMYQELKEGNIIELNYTGDGVKEIEFKGLYGTVYTN